MKAPLNSQGHPKKLAQLQRENKKKKKKEEEEEEKKKG